MFQDWRNPKKVSYSYLGSRLASTSNHDEIVLLQLLQDVDQQLELTGDHMNRQRIVSITEPRDIPGLQDKSKMSIHKLAPSLPPSRLQHRKPQHRTQETLTRARVEYQ